jgi:hypothetical protein
MLYTGCSSAKKDSSSDTNSKQKAADEVSMKPTASDEDPAYVYFTADSSGYSYTYRIKSNGTGLEKLYESKAGPIWISPDNRYVYITDQVTTSKEKDPFCPKGITIWDIEKKIKTVLPFYDDPTWGSGWYDNDNILYSKSYYASKKSDFLFKQNIHTGDTSIVFYWDKPTRLNAVYNKKDYSYYYISDDSLYVFKEKSRRYLSYPVAYHDFQPNKGSVMLTKDDSALFFRNFDEVSGHKNIVTDLKGKTLFVVDKSIDHGSTLSYMKIDKNGKWIYYNGYIDIGGTAYSFIKRKCLTTGDKTETIFMTKMDDMSIGYIALGYNR